MLRGHGLIVQPQSFEYQIRNAEATGCKVLFPSCKMFGNLGWFKIVYSGHFYEIRPPPDYLGANNLCHFSIMSDQVLLVNISSVLRTGKTGVEGQISVSTLAIY